jgi:hypothetical protein
MHSCSNDPLQNKVITKRKALLKDTGFGWVLAYIPQAMGSVSRIGKRSSGRIDVSPLNLHKYARTLLEDLSLEGVDSSMATYSIFNPH